MPVHVFAEVLHPTTARVDRPLGTAIISRTRRRQPSNRSERERQSITARSSTWTRRAISIKRYAGGTGLKPLLADVPEQVEVTRRTKGEADFYFLLNHGDSPVTVNVGRRLY